jgi:membrane protein involved in colicin uptake
MNNLGNLTNRFKKVGLNKTRKSFIGLKRAASTRRIVVAARMKSKAEAKAEIERKEEELKAIRKAKLKATRKARAAELKAARNANVAKLKATRNAEAAELKKLEEKETHAQANLNGLMNAFGKMNFAK